MHFDDVKFQHYSPPHIYLQCTHADPFDGFQGGSISLLPEDLSTSGQSPPGSASGQLPPDGSSGDVIVSSGSGDTSPPDIINWENHHSVMIGAVLELSCKATGTPQPTVSWISRGVQVGEEEEDQGVRTRPNGSLIIWKVGMEHEGRYKCVAWNHHGLAFRTTEVAVVTGEASQQSDSIRLILGLGLALYSLVPRLWEKRPGQFKL